MRGRSGQAQAVGFHWKLAGGPAGIPQGSQDRDGNCLELGTARREAYICEADEGFRGAGVLEIVDDFDGDTYRAVYTVKFEDIVYVLHAFQKKSKKGIATPKSDLDLVKVRYKFAEEAYRELKAAKR